MQFPRHQATISHQIILGIILFRGSPLDAALLDNGERVRDPVSKVSVLFHQHNRDLSLIAERFKRLTDLLATLRGTEGISPIILGRAPR